MEPAVYGCEDNKINSNSVIRRYRGACPYLVAEARSGMALSLVQGA